MYRAFALTALKNKAENDRNLFLPLLANFSVEFYVDGDNQHVICNGEDVTDKIRTPEVSMWASTLSKEKEVREKMGYLQRKIGEKGKVVAEGRDMGTVVFDDAFAKFFLEASSEVRAERRFKELKGKGLDVSYREVLADIIKRDEQDSSRNIAPLKPADDAVIIDTSSLSIEEVVDFMYFKVQEKLKTWKS
ncbi:MAG: (d)CMP kinase [bacterium]